MFCLRGMQDLGALRSPRHVFVSYPRTWVVELPSHTRAVERAALTWLRERGVVHDARSERVFELLSVGEYANWPFATAPADRAAIITKFLSLWIFYDDVIEEAGEGRVACVEQAVAGVLTPGTLGDVHLDAWAELGRACAGVMSPTFMARHARRFAAWVEAVSTERRAALDMRASGTRAPLSQHLERRRHNIGMFPNLDFLEYQMGWELPEAVLVDPLHGAVERSAADAVAIVNDLFGFTKDRAGSWPNLVDCAMHELELDPPSAFRVVCELHDARVRALARDGRSLLCRHPGVVELARWLEGLHHVVYGFARWHSRAPRYQSRHTCGPHLVQLDIRHDAA